MQIKFKLIPFAIIELLCFITGDIELYIWYITVNVPFSFVYIPVGLWNPNVSVIDPPPQSLKPLTTNPSEDISLNTSVKFGKYWYSQI